MHIQFYALGTYKVHFSESHPSCSAHYKMSRPLGKQQRRERQGHYFWDAVDLPILGTSFISAKLHFAAGALALSRYPDLESELPINQANSK